MDTSVNFVQHARTELELCGQFDEDPAYAQSLLAAIAALSTYGHSGGSMECAIDQLVTLLQFRALGPLTDDPGEWMAVGNDMWQNRRQSDAFSTDGGKTYYLLNEGANDQHQEPLHQSHPSCEVYRNQGIGIDVIDVELPDTDVELPPATPAGG